MSDDIKEPEEVTKRKYTKSADKAKTVKVVAKYPPFIDLINNIEITGEPTPVEMHPWLQAQVDAGKLVVVE